MLFNTYPSPCFFPFFTGHCSLWTSRRLLQRWRIHQVTIFLLFAFIWRCSLPYHTFMIFVKQWSANLFLSFQFSEQVPSESSGLCSTARAVPESHWYLWTGATTLTSKRLSTCLWRGLNSLLVDLWFQVATYAMDSTLLKYSAKDYFFKAALCHFCVDMLNSKVSSSATFVCVHRSQRSNFESLVSKIATQKYEGMFPAFSDSRECKLLKVGFGVFISNIK